VTTDLIFTMTPDRAHELTRLLQEDCSTLTEHATEAYYGRVWEFLGYDTWDIYCTAEGIHVPREFIPELRAEGLSQRAIAAATGVHRRTVERDLEVGGANAPPESEPEGETEPEEEPERVTGLDGKSYPATRPPAAKAKPIDTDRSEWHKGKRHVDPNRVVTQIAMGLEAQAVVDFESLEWAVQADPAVKEAAVVSIRDSLKTLHKFLRRLEASR
jgi:hypothetical protein